MSETPARDGMLDFALAAFKDSPNPVVSAHANKLADAFEAEVRAAVPSVPADRAALSAKLWAIAEHHIVAEWICCEPVDPKHELCAKGHAALHMARTLLVDSPEAWNPAAPLLDAVLAELLPEPADRAALLADEASLIELHCPDHGPQDQDGVWMDCHCAVAEDMRKRAAELRRMAVEAQQPETQCSRQCSEQHTYMGGCALKPPPMDPRRILGIDPNFARGSDEPAAVSQPVGARQADTAGEQPAT